MTAILPQYCVLQGESHKIVYITQKMKPVLGNIFGWKYCYYCKICNFYKNDYETLGKCDVNPMQFISFFGRFCKFV